MSESVINRLVVELKRDKKRTGLLCLLLAVGLFVGGKAIFKSSGSPGSASAAVCAARTTSDEIARSERSAGERTAADESARDKYIEQINRRISRDLFRVNLDIFPLLEAPVIKPAPGTDTTTAPAQPNPEEVKRQTILAQAKALSLMMTVSGKTPTAVINDRVLRKGEWINDFEVADITDHSCTVQKEGVQVVLQMSKPK